MLGLPLPPWPARPPYPAASGLSLPLSPPAVPVPSPARQSQTAARLQTPAQSRAQSTPLPALGWLVRLGGIAGLWRPKGGQTPGWGNERVPELRPGPRGSTAALGPDSPATTAVGPHRSDTRRPGLGHTSRPTCCAAWGRKEPSPVPGGLGQTPIRQDGRGCPPDDGGQTGA